MSTYASRLAVAAALLVASASSQALFLTSSGGTRSTFKGIQTGTDLVCDLKGLPIEATVSPPTLVLGGTNGYPVMCYEVPTGTFTSTPAFPLPPGTFSYAGMFQFKQVAPPSAAQDCTEVTANGAQITWSCRVKTNSTFARWIVRPLETNAFSTICAGIADPATNCYAEHGTPLSTRREPLLDQFVARDVDGVAGNDLGDDEIVRFSLPGNRLVFGPCHSGTFEGGSPVLCNQRLKGVNYPTKAAGSAITDVEITLDVAPTLNLSNSSETSGVPTRLFGSAVFGVQFAGLVPGSVIRVTGSAGSADAFVQSVSAAQDVNGDGFPDLDININRLSFLNAVRTANNLNCPLAQTTVNVRLSGAYGGASGAGRWFGADTLVAGCN